MTPRSEPGVTATGDVTLLYVATVSATIRQFLIPYAAHFRARGWQVHAAANGATTDPALQGHFDGLHEVPLSRSVLDLGGWIRGQRAMSTLLATRPDIVHVHTPIASFVTRLRSALVPVAHRPAVAYTAHGFHFHRAGHLAANSVFLAAEKIAGRWTDRLVVINDEDEAAARRHRIVAPSRLVRMPGIGLDTDYYSRTAIDPTASVAARRGLGVEAGLPLFLVVGELSRRKRPGDVVEALALMRNDRAIVVLVGSGSERDQVEELARRRGVLHRVHFAGFLADVRALVAAATAVVLVSDREGLARAIMEALALEVPVIASTARGNAELVEEETGIIVPTADVSGLARAMDWLVEHPIEREAMGRAGRPRMVARYDIRLLLTRHEEMYAAMLADRAPSAP
ncbi:MAG TPA: glycosyltransferase [Candidatus Limnocylindrales bacterium]|nr:glycosyltransferase [Candidatus Limnocylindrales bacterium]